MATLAVIVFLVLAVIALTHVAWGLGLRWPGRDEASLVALVIGATGRTRMPPPAHCFMVAAAIFAAGLVALAVGGVPLVPAPRWLLVVASAGVAAVFAGRGGAAYTSAWRKRFSQRPFATMDRNVYGPLCLLLAACFLAMTIWRMVT